MEREDAVVLIIAAYRRCSRMVASLDSANNQLSNISYATTSLEIAFNGFYAQLDDNLAESPKLAQ